MKDETVIEIQKEQFVLQETCKVDPAHQGLSVAIQNLIGKIVEFTKTGDMKIIPSSIEVFITPPCVSDTTGPEEQIQHIGLKFFANKFIPVELCNNKQ